MEIQLWREILNPYELAVEELKVKFNHNIREHRESGLYSPIEQVLGRVKSVTSIIEKANKKNIPIDKIEEEIEDIAGIRIMCQFVEDIYAIADTEHLAMSAPIISSYCAASVLWSRIFLKEKLSKKHYFMIVLVVIGIAIMGFLDM